MIIRKMTIDDYDEVYDLWLNTPGMGLNTIDDSKVGIHKFLNRNPETCFVAEMDQRIVGVILCGNDGRRGYIYHMAVSTAKRNQGIGTALVNAALNALEIEGITKVALVVFAQNELGNDFWEKRGFHVRGDLFYRNKSIMASQRMDI